MILDPNKIYQFEFNQFHDYDGTSISIRDLIIQQRVNYKKLYFFPVSK